MSTELLKRQFSIQDYHQMVVAGILSEDERVELIQGEIVQMSPVGIRHASCVKRLNRLFSQLLGDRNSPKLSQFMNKYLRDRTIYDLSFWDMGYTYDLGQTRTGEWIGARYENEFEYNL